MKKISTILFISLCIESNSQLTSIVVRNDTTFSVNPSTGVWTQLTNVVPATTGQSGKYLSTNGTTYTWSMPTSSATWGTITGTLSTQTDLQTALTAKADLASPTFTGTVIGITAAMVGLGNVNNTSDASKPISTAMQTALDLKQDILTNNGGWNTLRVSGSNATTTGQTLVNITGLVTPTLLNATLYEVEAVLYASTTAVTTGTQYAFTANGTGGAATVFINISGTTTTNAATTVTQSASATAVGTFLTTSGSSGIIVLKGFILTRGSGTATIALQHLKITSGTSTVFIGSVLRYRLAQ